MYNFCMAFAACCVVYLIGDAVSRLTRAWVPSVFVTAAVMLTAFWTGILPTTVVSDAALIPFGASVGLYLMLVHMGTIISLRQLAEQWKTIVVCLAGLAGMCLACWFIGMPVIGRELVVAGLPPLTGGIVAATVMRDAAEAAGLETAALFATAMYCVQGFIGYPLTVVCLQIRGRQLLRERREGRSGPDADGGGTGPVPAAGKKLLGELPARWNGPVMILFKMGVVAWLATQCGRIPFPGVGPVSGAVWALVLGVIGTSVGFLDVDSLHRANAYGLVMFALMMYVFDGLKTATPALLARVIGPMLFFIVIGVAGMALFVFAAAKLLRVRYPLALASGLTALYGFPPNAIITENTCRALGETSEEFDYLMREMYPSMIVGGITTVTLTSVVIAGFFARLL